MKYVDVDFLDHEQVRDAHVMALIAGDTIIAAGGVRDHGMLHSAVMAPQAGYYTSLAAIAAAYAHGIAKNHPFIDGNKRTAFLAAFLFLDMNGFKLEVDREQWREIILAVVDGRMTREQLTDCFADALGSAVELE